MGRRVAISDAAVIRLADYRKAKDQLPGGKADEKTNEDFDQEAIDKGREIEFEHTDDPSLAEEIARDHLEEFPSYYDALGKMEKELKKKSFSSNRSVEEIMSQEPEIFNSAEPLKNDVLAPTDDELENPVTLSNQNEKEAYTVNGIVIKLR